MRSRGWLWLRSQWPFVLVVALIVGACGYLYLSPGHWVRASAVIALALVLAGIFRAAMPSANAGLLVVRGRSRDAVTYLLLGVVILGAAIHLR